MGPIVTKEVQKILVLLQWYKYYFFKYQKQDKTSAPWSVIRSASVMTKVRMDGAEWTKLFVEVAPKNL